MKFLSPKVIVDFLDHPGSVQDIKERQSFAERIVIEADERFADQALLLECVSEECRDADFLRRINVCRQALVECSNPGGRSTGRQSSGTINSLLEMQARESFTREFNSLASKYAKFASSENYSISHSALEEYIGLFNDSIAGGFWSELHYQVIFKSIFRSKNLTIDYVDYLFELAEVRTNSVFSTEIRHENKRLLLTEATNSNKAGDAVVRHCLSRLIDQPVLIGRNELASIMFKAQYVTALQMLEIISVNYGAVTDRNATSSVDLMKYEKREQVQKFFDNRKEELFHLAKENHDILDRSFIRRDGCDSCRIEEALNRYNLTDAKSIIIAGILASKTERLIDDVGDNMHLSPSGSRRI